MAVTVWQRKDESFTVDIADPSDDQTWIAMGSYDDLEVKAAMDAALPGTFLGLWLQKYTLTHVGGGFWEARVHYGKIKPMLESDTKFSGDTTGGTIHLETGGEPTKYALPDAAAAPDFGGLIGVTADGVA